ncbi:MAG: response regulator transcription factor [Saprospiraceae bacterium]|nr:response regulator transcription factor [Saprospiraceae bacterium]
MKQSVNPEIVRSLLEVEDSIRIKHGDVTGPEKEQNFLQEHPNQEMILSRIQKIHHLVLKERHKEIHGKLSLREVEIILQICKGKTTEEIAGMLNLSKHTVESHRTNIFSKLDVRNSMELVALAFRVGLVM